jgi:hypothetical protein
MAAIQFGRKETAKLLLEKGADVNVLESISINPPHEMPILLIAIVKGDVDITKLLIEKGAGVNVKSSLGVTPLMVAILSGHKRIVKHLLENGADSNALVPVTVGSSQQMTILFTAIAKGDIEITKLLVDKGADVNLKSNDGQQVLSPLEFALKHGKQDIAQLLIGRGSTDTPESSALLKASVALDDHTKMLEAKLATLCKDAGEKITKTIENVDGIYIELSRDTPDENFSYYHESERYPMMYVMPKLGRHYRFVEIGPFRHRGQGIEHRPAVPQPGETTDISTYTTLTEPQASYGFKWKALTTRQEQLQGLHGDEVTIFHIKTQEVLATRKIFFYVIKGGLINADGYPIAVPSDAGKFVTCKNYSLPEEESVTRRPSASYKFVSRVLRPPAMPVAEAARVFDLARGSGNKASGCSLVSFGPKIELADLRLSRDEFLDLQISIADTEDILGCKYRLSAAGFKNRESDRVFIFYDGTRLRLGDLLDRLPQPATARLYSLAIGSGTTRSKTCFLPTVGPNITLNDLEFSQVNNDLHVATQNVNDVLICSSFLHPSRLKNFSENIELTFYDGQTMNLLRAFQKRSPISSVPTFSRYARVTE